LELSHGQNFIVAAPATRFSISSLGNIFRLSLAEAQEGFVFLPLIAHGKNWSVPFAVGGSFLQPWTDCRMDGGAVRWGHQSRGTGFVLCHGL